MMFVMFCSFLICHFVFFLMIRRPPRSTRTDTLSLHDALPICSASARVVATRSRTASAGCVLVGKTMNTVRPGVENLFRSEEHTSELQSLMRISYAVFCLKKKKKTQETVTQTEERQ